MNGIYSLISVYCEEDLKPRPGQISINPPPADGRCECCGRHISELKPFGKAGDPLRGDFEGAYLVKIYRPDAPYNEEIERAIKEAEKQATEDPFEWLIIKYGEEKASEFYSTEAMYSNCDRSWECRECIVLGDYEYFEVYNRNHPRDLSESSGS